MSSLLFMTDQDYLNLFIPMMQKEEIENTNVYNISNNYANNGEYEFIIGLKGTLVPPSYIESHISIDHNEEKYKREYMKFLDDIKNKTTLSVILMEILENDKTGIILCDNYEAEQLFLLAYIKEYIKEEFDIEGYNTEDYFKNRDNCKIHNREEKLHKIRSIIYHKSRQFMGDIYDTFYCPKNPRVYFTREDLLQFDRELIKIGKELQIEEARRFPDTRLQLDVEERWGLVDAIWTFIEERNKKFIESQRLDEMTLEELLWFGLRLNIRIPTEYSKVEALEMMRKRVKDLDYELDMYSRPKLNKLENFELIEVARNLGIELNDDEVFNDRDKAITKIITTKDTGLTVDYTNIESLMCEPKDKLIRVYINIFNGEPSLIKDRDTIPKMLLVRLIVNSYKCKEEIRFVKSLDYNYIIKTPIDLIKLDFIKNAFTCGLVTIMKNVVKMTNKEDIFLYLMGVIGIKGRYASIDLENLPTRKEYIKLPTTELESFGKSIGAITLPGIERSNLVRYIDDRMEQITFNKARIKKRAEVTLDNLLRLDRQKLIKFCKSNSIDYKYDWSKKKICREIMKVYNRAKEREQLEKEKMMKKEA